MNWSKGWEIIPPSQSFSEKLAEQNESVRQTIIGVDKGSKDKNIINGQDVELNIPLDGGWNIRKIRALQINDLAVVISGDPENHCIVHVPTLTWFDGALPEGEYSNEQLLIWCWKVQQSQHDLWEELRKFDNSNYKNINKRILELLQDYCLSVEV